MFFLLRMAFWLGVVCVLLPLGSSQPVAPEAKIDAGEAVSLASAAVSDARGFCDRQPQACAVGGKVAVAIGHKAEAGARMIYDFVAGKLAERPATSEKADTRQNWELRGTLSAADIEPAWRAPVPLPPRRPAA